MPEENIVNNIETVVTISNAINLLKLEKELKVIYADVAYLIQKGFDTLIIVYNTEPSDTIENALITTVHAHTDYCLESGQKYAKIECEEHYQKLLNDGMVYNEKTIACTETSQNKFSALMIASAGIPFPFTIPDKDNKGVLLLSTITDLQALYGALFLHCSTLFALLSNAQGNVQSATTQAEIDQIVKDYTE